MKISAIILAAGEGTRLNSGKPSTKAKVLYEVAGKPMLFYSLDILEKIGVNDIVIVVGHLQDQIRSVVNKKIKFAVQEKAIGTADAVRVGLKEVDRSSDYVLVLYGADIYRQELIENLINKNQQAVMSFLTANRENPTGLGRIVRDKAGNVKAIVEEKVATEEEKQIKEVNDGGYLFKRDWLVASIEKLQLTKANEYFLTDLVELAVSEGLEVKAQKIEGEDWFGVDTPEQIEKTTQFVEKNWKKTDG
jgi:bifunctional UDP-N-acetylglucosamine pyrophosphorylase/glucosamine-1-phosphate N-acetyltransferase